MRKIIVSLVAILSLYFTQSCSGDDIVEVINKGFVIGEWQLSSVTENDGSVDLNECQLMKTLKFEDIDGTRKVVITIYDFDEDQICEINTSTTSGYHIDGSKIVIGGMGNNEISTPRNETLVLTSTEGAKVVKSTYKRQ